MVDIFNFTMLFIGGFADGEWRDIPEGQDRYKIITRKSLLQANISPVPQIATFNTVMYHKVELAWNERRFCVMVLDGIRDEELLGILMEGYRKNKKGLV